MTQRIPVWMAASLMITPSVHAQGFCAPLKTVIASEDFRRIQSGDARPEGGRMFWASSVEMPGASTTAYIGEADGARIYATEFGTWENLPVLGQPSLPEQREIDSVFTVLARTISACLPQWPKRVAEHRWDVTWTGPSHSLRLAALHNDDDTWIQLQLTQGAQASAGNDREASDPALSAVPLDEKFDDNRRGWLLGSGADYSATVDHGRYTIEKKTPEGTLFTWIPIAVDGEHPYTVTARFTIKSGGDQGVGVIWEVESRENFNGVYLRRDGLTTWGQNVGGTWQAEAEWRSQLIAYRTAKWRCYQRLSEGTYEVVLRPSDSYKDDAGRTVHLVTVAINGCPLGTAHYTHRGSNFGFAINGVATVTVDRLAVTQP